MEVIEENSGNFDALFDETGWGFYSKFLISLAGFCLFSEGVASTSIQFVLPISTCNVKLSDTIILLVNFSHSLGMAFGGLIISSAADLFGRKIMLSSSLVTVFGSCLASGFSHEPIFISLSAFCLGSGLVSTINITKMTLMESLPSSKRTICMVLSDVFWSVGYILFPCICWAIMPYTDEAKVSQAKISTFRILYAVSGVLCVFVACAAALLQESPRFLVMQKKYDAALYSIRHIYCVNNSKHWQACQIKKDNLQGLIEDYGLESYQARATWFEQLLALRKRFITSMVKLVGRRYLKNLIVLTFLKVSTLFGIYLVNMWLMIVLTHDDSDCHLSSLDILHLESTDEGCKFIRNNTKYMYFVIIASCALFGQVALLALIEFLDRRRIIVCAFVLSGVCSFLMAFIKDVHSFKILSACILMASYSILESTLSLVALESFPTALRGTATAQVQVLGHILGGILKIFLDMPCQFSYIYIGSIMLASSTVAYFLPEFRHKPITE